MMVLTAGLANCNNQLNREIRAWIKSNAVRFDDEVDSVVNDLLPRLKTFDRDQRIPLERDVSKLRVEHFQTFLFRALFFMQEFKPLAVPPVTPSQKRRRSINDTRFNLFSALYAGHPVQQPDFIKRTRASMEDARDDDARDAAADDAAATTMPATPSSIDKRATASGGRSTAELTTPSPDPRQTAVQQLMESLDPTQLNLFRHFSDACSN